MNVQKYNSRNIIFKYDSHIDPSKTEINQIEDYIDNLNMENQTGLFMNLSVNGGTWCIIGSCVTTNSWSMFLVFSYISSKTYKIWRNDTGSWSAEQIA